MLTPAFDISQTEDFLELSIKAPYTNVSEAEVFIEEYDLKFYAKPYYLRITLPAPVVEDHRATANYNSSQGIFIIKLPKVNPGEVFEGLDLLTKLLSPAKKTSHKEPVIEVLNSDDKSSVLANESGEEEEDEFDWLIEQIPYSEPDISVDGPKYGFANQKSGVFKRLQTELHDIIDLPDADSTLWSDRTRLREQDEKIHFDEDHYMADYCETDYLESLLNYTPEWEPELYNPGHVSFSDDEKEKMRKLPRKEYLLDADMCHQSLLALVDILFAYAYNHRTTEGENTVESAWTICKLSSTLSWLQIHTHSKDTVRCCFRRSLVYPLYRNWSLAVKIFSDVQNIFHIGQKRILKCLLEIHSLLNESDPRYVLNDLYITDLCVWIQAVSEKEFRSMAKHLMELKMSKEEIGLELDLIEKACSLTNDEELDEVSHRMNTLTVLESAHTGNQLDDQTGLSEDVRNYLYLGSSTESETEDTESETEESETETEDSETETGNTKTETENRKLQMENTKPKREESKIDNSESVIEVAIDDSVEQECVTRLQYHHRVETNSSSDPIAFSDGIGDSTDQRVQHKSDTTTAECSRTPNIDSSTLKF